MKIDPLASNPHNRISSTHIAHIPAKETLMKRFAPLALLLLLPLVGCGEDEPPTSRLTPVADVEESSEPEYLSEDVTGPLLVQAVQSDAYTYPALSTWSSEGILGVGNVVCDQFEEGLSLQQAVTSAVVGTDGWVTHPEAASFIGAATAALCPEYEYKFN